MRVGYAMGLVLGAWSLSSAALAQDVGEIALVEDVDGSINQSIAAPNFYLSKAACAFYGSHPDAYDALFVFTSIPQNFLTNVQQGWPVKQDQQGIGRTPWDQTATFCSSTGRLRMTVKMGDLNQLPQDPDARYTGIPLYPLSGIQLLAHEFGHHWLASVTFDHGDGVRHCLLRGFEPSGEPQSGACDGYDPTNFNQHWSYYFNSGSLMYGSMIEDLGGGRFRLTYDNPKYCPLDQYLMGLRSPADVGSLFLVDVGDVAGSGSSSVPIQPGQSSEIDGTRMDFTVQDVIRAEGERQPASEPCHWKAAFLIVHAAGTPPSAAEIARVDGYRRRWDAFFPWATDDRGSFDTTLDGRGTGTATCPGQATPDGGPQDGGVDGGVDAGSDAGADSGMDAGADSGMDAGSDPGIDAGADPGMDAGADPGNPDASGDSPGGGGGCGCGASGAGGGLGPLLVLFWLARRRST